MLPQCCHSAATPTHGSSDSEWLQSLQCHGPGTPDSPVTGQIRQNPTDSIKKPRSHCHNTENSHKQCHEVDTNSAFNHHVKNMFNMYCRTNVGTTNLWNHYSPIFEINLRIFTCKIFGRSFEHGFNAFSGVNSTFFSFESFWTILFWNEFLK